MTSAETNEDLTRDSMASMARLVSTQQQYMQLHQWYLQILHIQANLFTDAPPHHHTHRHFLILCW